MIPLSELAARLTREFAERHKHFLTAQILSTPPACIGENELLNAFSWVKPPDMYCESRESTSAGSQPNYLDDVRTDTNFFNPSSVDMMVDAYRIDNEYISCSSRLEDLLKKHAWTIDDCVDQVKLNKSNDRLKKGIAFSRSEKYADAISQLSDAIDIYPTADAYVARGAAYANIGAYVLAVDDFRDALKLDPAHTNASAYLYTTMEKVANMNVSATSLSNIPSSAKDSIRKDDAREGVGSAGSVNNEDAKPVAIEEIQCYSLYKDGKLTESISRIRECLSPSDSDSSGSEDDGNESDAVSKKKGKKRKREEMKHSKERKNKKSKHHRSSKKEKKTKSSKSHKKSKIRSKSGTPIMSPSEASSAAEDVHPILQRQPHKLWG